MLASLPLALGIALSPFAILPAVLVLLGPRPRAAGYAFGGAWLLGVVMVAFLVGSLAFVTSGDRTPLWAAILRVVLGASLVAWGLAKWAKRGAATAPAWLGSVTDATPAAAARLGLLLTAANPKVIMLAGAGGATIGATASTWAQELAGTIVFGLVAASTALAPVLAHTMAGDRIGPALARTRDWLDAHTSALLAAVTLAIGVAVLWSGVSTVIA